MHTINMSFSMSDQPSNISHAELISNSFILTHTYIVHANPPPLLYKISH